MLNSTIKNGGRIALTIIGTTIGAGFASGREIWEFFTSYGLQSVIGITIAMILFSISSMIILWISWKNRTTNYFELLILLMGKRLAKLFDVFIFLYLISGSIVMFAGSGATFKQWNIPFLLGVVIIAVAIWLVIIRGVNGLMNLNSLLVPFLIIIIVFVSYNYVIHHSIIYGDFLRQHLKVWPSAVTYAAFNVISLLGVLSTMGAKINSKKEIVLGGILSSIGLTLVAIVLNLALLRVHMAQKFEIPLFALIEANQEILSVLVTIILWLAIYTTALSNIHGIVSRVQKKVNYSTEKISAIFIFGMIPLAFIGFSTLVKYLYPFYGVVNLYVLAVLILYPFQFSSNDL